MKNNVKFSVKDLDLYYGKFHALKGIDMDIPSNEVTAFIGPSGCGKSTFLKSLNRMNDLVEGCKITGDVRLDGDDIYSGMDINLLRKRVGMVFQQPNPFPMSVYDNIAYGPRTHGIRNRAKLDEIVERSLRQAAIWDELKDRLKKSALGLSGGQQQRVAIARTLAPEPQVLFMDEPLSNLDAKLRLEMRYELQRLHVETGSTFVYVTHDQMEAMTLATKICLINNGVLQQYEAPLSVYNRPNNLFVADFVGNPSINFVEAKGKQNADGSIEMTILNGKKALFRSEESVELSRWFAQRDKAEAEEKARYKEQMQDKKAVEKSNKDEVFKYHIARVNEDDYVLKEEPVITNEDFVIGIRPEALHLHETAGLDGVIYGAMPTGMESTIKLRIGEYLLTGVVFGNTAYKIGQNVKFEIAGDDILLFDRKSGRRIASGNLSV